MPIFSPAVACCEEHGQVSEQQSRDGANMQVTLRVAWSLRYALIADLLGNRRPWPHGGWADPPRAVSCSCVPFPSVGIVIGQGQEYEDALVTVTYSHGQEADLISESLEPNVEFLKLDYRKFKWDNVNGDPLTEDEAPGRILRSMNLVRTLYQIQPPLPVSLLNLPGYCNEDEYVSALLGLTFPEETLLFQPPVPTRTITTAGSRGFNLTMRFAYKDSGWNRYWRSKTGTYQGLVEAKTGAEYVNYPLGDFSDFLF